MNITLHLKIHNVVLLSPRPYTRDFVRTFGYEWTGFRALFNGVELPLDVPIFAIGSLEPDDLIDAHPF